MVELRSGTILNSRMHYIRAIKNESIKIVMNMDARRKSNLKFRQLVDVYDCEHQNNDEPIPRVVRDMENVSDLTQGSCLFGDEVSGELEYFNNTTLEKIQEKCKDKKRKLRNSRDTETTSNVEVKQEHLNLDKECDLEEPLSAWNTKSSKRIKAKQKPKAKCGSTTSPSVKKGDFPLLCVVKPEVWNDSYSGPEVMDFIPTDPSLDFNKESESPTHTELVEEIIMHDSFKDTRLTLYCSAEPKFLGMVSIQDAIATELVEKAFEDASEEFSRARNVQYSLDDNVALHDEEIISYSNVPREEIELEVPQHSESENIGCVTNHISLNTSSDCEDVKEDVESNDSVTNLGMNIAGLEIMKVEEIIMHDSFKDTRLTLCCSAEPNFPGMVAIEDAIATELVDKAFEGVSEDFSNARNVQCSHDDNVALHDNEIVLYGNGPREEVELEVPQHSESENIGFVTNRISLKTSLGCEDVTEDMESNDSVTNLGMNITGLEIVKVEEIIMHDSFKDTRLTLCCSAEPNFPGMVAIEDAIATELVEKAFEDVSEEFSNSRNVPCSLDDNVALHDNKNVLYGNGPREEVELEVPQHSESENIGCVTNHISLKTSLGCEDVTEDMESNDSVTNLGMNITGLETVKVEEIIMHDSFKDLRLTLCCSAEPNFPGIVAIEDAIATKLVEKAFEDVSEEFSNARNVPCSLDDNVNLQDNEIVLYGNVPREEVELEVPQHSESENNCCVTNHISLNTSLGCEDVTEDMESNDSVNNLGMNISGIRNVKVEAPKVLGIDYSSFPFMDYGLKNTEILLETEDIAKDDLPVATDVLQLTNYDNTLYNMLLVPYDSRISLEEGQLPERLQESSSSTHEDEAAYHKSSQLYKAPDKVQKPQVSDIILHSKTHHQPEKLLSGRKAFSPTSQEKLRKAIEQPRSPEKRSKKSKGKLYFSSHHSHRILKAQGLDNIDIVDVIPNSKRKIQKTNINTRQTQYQRFTHKFPRQVNRAAKLQPFSTGSTSLQGCSQKAVAFSQGQIRDFQYVADMLTKELRSMRQITKRCLQAEGNRFNMTVSNLDEVNTMIKNSEKTEEGSKKWLSMIERDCTRFCKLMGMVKEHSPATDNIVQKKRKIRFADDAGGDLCHVKVYEID